MIAATVSGLAALNQRLAALPRNLAAQLGREVERLGDELRARVERNLSGDVLQRRSGRLAASVAVDVERSGLAIGLTVSSASPYAAIHEYGGTIPARTVLPRSARALAFPWRGQQRFLKRARLPAVTLPERSFLRSALAGIEPEFRAAVEAIAAEAMQA